MSRINSDMNTGWNWGASDSIVWWRYIYWHKQECVLLTSRFLMATEINAIFLNNSPYLFIHLVFSTVSGSVWVKGPALNDGIAGCLTCLHLQESQYFIHCIHCTAVQGGDNQIVNKSNKAGHVRNKDIVSVTDVLEPWLSVLCFCHFAYLLMWVFCY